MSKKVKVSDEQIIEKIEKGFNNRRVALELGLTPSGTFNIRCNELRKHNGPVKVPLRFEDIQKDDRLMKDGKRLIVISIGEQGLSLKNMLGQINFLHRKEFEKRAIEYTKVPPGDPQGAPVKSYHVDPDPKLSAGDIKVNGKPIKNLPDNVKEKIVEKLKETVAPEPPIIPSLLEGRKPTVVNPEVDKLFEKVPEPLHIDLEIDSISDPVAPFGSAPDDYTDPEWFDKPIPRKGTVERAIWDKAYTEINEIQTLRSTILSALNLGERLPNTSVDLYNKYVSKYVGEVGV